MPDPSRRSVLQALAVVPVAIAGCSDQQPLTPGTEHGPDRRVVDLTARKVRDTAGRAVFWSGPDRDELGAEVEAAVLTGQPGDVSFAREYEPGATLRSFVLETDFGRRSVVLLQAGVGACHDLQLLQVGRGSDGLYPSLCRHLRPADTACDPETRDTVAFALRTPAAGDDLSVENAEIRRECRARRPLGIAAENATAEGDDG